MMSQTNYNKWKDFSTGTKSLADFAESDQNKAYNTETLQFPKSTIINNAGINSSSNIIKSFEI